MVAEQEATFHVLHSKHKVGPQTEGDLRIKTLKAGLSHTKPYLLTIPKEHHQSGTSCSNARDYGGPFSLKLTHPVSNETSTKPQVNSSKLFDFWPSWLSL